MSTFDRVLSWVQSFGIGGAFFLLALAAFGLCAMALWVVLVALKHRGTP